MFKSCFYEGIVYHSRKSPRRHGFRLGLYMVFLDLDELGDLFGRCRLLATGWPWFNRFRRRDYFGSKHSLKESLLDFVNKVVLGQSSTPKGVPRTIENVGKREAAGVNHVPPAHPYIILKSEPGVGGGVR